MQQKGSRGARYDTRPKKKQQKLQTGMSDSNDGTHIIRQNVQRPVIAVCFLLETIPKVMFCDKMASTWMKTPGEEAAHDQINKGFDSEH